MKKIKFRKCFACFSGHICDSRKRIPRKKKKELKKVYSLMRLLFRLDWMYDGVTSCDLSGGYKYMKPYFKHYSYFKKNRLKINFIMNVANQYNEAILVLENGDLSFQWTWEDDNGLYTTNGSMPFIYKREQFNGTWAGSETENLLEILGIEFGSVLSDKELISKIDLKSYKIKAKEEDSFFADEEIFI